MVENAEIRTGRSENHDNERKPGARWTRFKAVVASVALAGTLAAGACSNEESGGIPPIPSTDGGCETDTCNDGGNGGDGGTGGMDSGTGGHDGGTGGMDSGTGGMDSGTGGMDSGTGGDGGMGGMDSGTGGSDGGPVACGTATTGAFSGNIPSGGSQNVGGYVFTYNGKNGGDADISVTCDGSPTGSYTFPEDVTTTIDLPADGKSLKVTPHSIGVQVNVDIQVVNYP